MTHYLQVIRNSHLKYNKNKYNKSARQREN